MKTLELNNITFSYRKGETIFKDFSFKITQPKDKGFIVGLMGKSGSGKTTILKLILGIEKDYRGNIFITPTNPTISYVPQEPVLFEHLTPLENAKYFYRIKNYKSKFKRELFNEIATTLQINDVLENSTSVNEISGGQRQKISLLRAMSIQPDILLLDEPLTSLDEEVKDQFLQTLVTLVHRFNLMVVYVTHNRKEAEFISDEIMYLEKGNNTNTFPAVSQTKTKQFFNKPPSISALNAIKEMHINTLQFKQNETSIIEPVDWHFSSMDSNLSFISFQDSTIQFSNNSGFEFEVVAETGTHTLLKLKKTQIILTITNDLFKTKKNSNNKFILLSGSVNIFNNKGEFLRTTTINNNKIGES